MAQLLRQLGHGDRFAGFIAEAAADAGSRLGSGSIVGDDDWLLGQAAPADLVVAIGHPRAKAAVVRRYLAAGDRFDFPNLVHPSAVIEPGEVSLGRGNVITAGCVFTVDIEVGDFNLFNWTVTVGHDARIGSSCVLNPGAHISGGVVIGDRVLIGTGGIVLEGRSVGSDSSVGGGAVVTRDVPAGVTVVGVPARELATTAPVTDS